MKSYQLIWHCAFHQMSHRRIFRTHVITWVYRYEDFYHVGSKNPHIYNYNHLKVQPLRQQIILLETIDLSLIWPSSSGFPDQYTASLPVQNKASCLNGEFVENEIINIAEKHHNSLCSASFFIPGPPQHSQHLGRRMWADPDPNTKVLNIKLLDQKQDSILGLYAPVQIPLCVLLPYCAVVVVCCSQPMLSP